MADPYISEFKAANEASTSDPSQDFVEIVVDAGTDVSDLVVIVYKGGATTYRDEYSLAGKTPTQTIAGKDVYLINNTTDGFFLLANDGVAIVQVDDTNPGPMQPIVEVYQAISDGDGFVGSGDGLDGVTFTDVTPGGVQTVPSTEATETLDGGLTYTIIGSGYTPGEILCFAAGTLIETITGEACVEDLNTGDQIRTLDDGFLPLRWIGSTHVTSADLDQTPRLKPICISACALGDGCPARDLTVSPQHRVLVRSKIAERMFGTAEVLIPAKKLLALAGVNIVDHNPDGVTYYHLLFDKHQIVFSNGSPTETLFTGPMALRALSPESRAEIQTLFPKICAPEFHQDPARPFMENGQRATTLVQRHQKNAKPMFAPT
jgi:hypothetical protein